MKIIFLGSGGAFTDYRVNYQNNAIVETAGGPVLIDCGVTACQSLRELGVHPTEIIATLFTHLHADHASPEQLIWERFYGGKQGLPAFLKTRLVAPASLLNPLEQSLKPFVDIYTDAEGQIQDNGTAALIDFERCNSVIIHDVRFRFFRVPHVTSKKIDKAAFGIEIDNGRSRVLWSGDTTFAPEWIIKAAQDPRVSKIFHECLFAPAFKGTVHTHWQELQSLPEEIRQKIVLMHHTMVPEWADISLFGDAARRHQVFEL